MIVQQQHRASASLPVTASVTHTEKETHTQIVHAGFMLGSPLPHNPAWQHGFIFGFVAYKATTQVTCQTTNYSFSVSQPRPQTENPVHDLSDHSRGNPASAMLFEQKTTVTTTITVLYFGFVCRNSLAPRHSPGVEPSPKPLPPQAPKQLAADNAPAAPRAPFFEPAPQAGNVPATAPTPASAAPEPSATVSLKPVEPWEKPESSDWEKRSVEETTYRFDVWRALNRATPQRVSVSIKGIEGDIYLTPQSIDKDGLSFTGVDVLNNKHTIPFSAVSEVRVLSA